MTCDGDLEPENSGRLFRSPVAAGTYYGRRATGHADGFVFVCFLSVDLV